ncbi:putative ORfan [Saudi moumouvirus]|uniref:Uncharacterized protein n=1 Tax=Moumouvirus sp. 'Monve' TaxID=1128131 RepID=H2ED33_9VIRU|nr:hypothetical protein mv_L101 [Moumouvirus Monve]AQN68678.1 putative ORfan [Saudi moumouvirus]
MNKIIKIFPEQLKSSPISINKLEELIDNHYSNKYYGKNKKLEFFTIGSNNNNEIKSSLCISDTEYE